MASITPSCMIKINTVEINRYKWMNARKCFLSFLFLFFLWRNCNSIRLAAHCVNNAVQTGKYSISIHAGNVFQHKIYGTKQCFTVLVAISTNITPIVGIAIVQIKVIKCNSSAVFYSAVISQSLPLQDMHDRLNYSRVDTFHQLAVRV